MNRRQLLTSLLGLPVIGTMVPSFMRPAVKAAIEREKELAADRSIFVQMQSGRTIFGIASENIGQGKAVVSNGDGTLSAFNGDHRNPIGYALSRADKHGRVEVRLL